jgi:hypothetical protein
MSTLKPQIEEFINGEENLHTFSVKEYNQDNVKLCIDGDFDFVLKALDKGKFQASSEEEFLEDWVKIINEYCNQGKKDIGDVLIKVTFLFRSIFPQASDAYSDMMSSPTPKKEMDEDVFDDGLDLQIIEKKKDTSKVNISFEELKKYQQMFNVDSNSNKVAVDRLMKDYIELCKTDTSHLGFRAEPVDNNLFTWEVQFFDFDKTVCPDCKNFFFNFLVVVQDLKTYAKSHNGQDYVKLEMKFLPEYPYRPPV